MKDKPVMKISEGIRLFMCNGKITGAVSASSGVSC